MEVVGEQVGQESRLLRQGEVFAYAAMLTKSTHEQTTCARGHIELLALSHDDLIEVLRAFPEVYQGVYQYALIKYNYSIA